MDEAHFMLVKLVSLEQQVIATPVALKAAWRRKAPSGSATKLDGDTILVGSGSNPDTVNNLPSPQPDADK